ncbi:MAG: hypothetical protein ABJA81_11850, partial [Nocardioidaceae bacterium]
MFTAQMYDEEHREIDPRDVPATPTSSLCRSKLPEFAAVLNARVDALDEANQLQLAAEVTACMATLEWTRCTIASSFALKDACSGIVARATARSGGIQLRRLGGVGTPQVAESSITELALALG